MICKNCNHVFDGNFCSNCGQPADTHRLNLHFIWHDIQHGLFHFDQGIYFSIKEMYLRPGHSVREFIQGKRIHHFRPISLVIVLATIYGLLYHYFEINLFVSSGQQMDKLHSDANGWIAKHFSWLTLVTIPIYTLGTYIAFKKQGYNFIEYLVLNTFKASQRLSLHIATFPLLYYYNGTPTIKSVQTALYAIDLILIYWTNFQFFDHLSKLKVLARSFWSHIIFFISTVILLSIIIFIFYR